MYGLRLDTALNKPSVKNIVQNNWKKNEYGLGSRWDKNLLKWKIEITDRKK